MFLEVTLQEYNVFNAICGKKITKTPKNVLSYLLFQNSSYCCPFLTSLLHVITFVPRHQQLVHTDTVAKLFRHSVKSPDSIFGKTYDTIQKAGPCLLGRLGLSLDQAVSTFQLGKVTPARTIDKFPWE